ncbi:hypothetical protein AB2B38_003340 [Balneola sp. MJW-20]|uniref:hypothetical protein n=1 Tax=Gracilimonas aurantiaca TaxID=3234185 RepID=UPI003464F2F3
MIPLVSWSFFQGREYLRGNDFIPYLKKNMQTVGIGKDPDFPILTEDLDDHHLFMVGEIHGFKIPQQLDHELFAFLHQNHDFDTYLLEMDMSQAYFMNRFNETGSDSLLKRILSTWVVRPGQSNLDYIQRFKKLREIYQIGEGFTYIGNNGISDPELLSAHLSELFPNQSWEINPDLEDSTNLLNIKEQLLPIIEGQQALTGTNDAHSELGLILKNINYFIARTNREEVLTQNALDLYELHGLKNKNVYGYFGLGHTLKAPLKGGYEAMASRLIRKDDWFKGHLLAANFIFTDSHMAITSSTLPSFLQDDAPQTRVSVSHDSIWMSYLYGIEDLKRLTAAGTTTIFKLNGENSPYKESKRLLSMMQLLPMGPLMHASDDRNTAEYLDYVILVRDSDWAKPI